MRETTHEGIYIYIYIREEEIPVNAKSAQQCCKSTGADSQSSIVLTKYTFFLLLLRVS